MLNMQLAGKSNMQLLKHQIRGLDIAKSNPRWGFFWDTGTGKTLLGLSIIKQKHIRTLIIAPKALLQDAWIGDACKFYPELFAKMVNFHTIKNRRGALDKIQKAEILVINYESILTNPDILQQNWQMLILDESQKIKNPKSKVTKLILKHAINIPYIYLLSGTPAPNNEMEYYPQLRLLNPDKIHKSWYNFRLNYFDNSDRMGWSWKLKQSKQQEFVGLLQNSTSVIRKSDVLDLKGQYYRIINYELTAKEKKAYKDMLRKLVVEIGNDKITATQAITKLMKLRQLLSGFIIDTDAKSTTETGHSKLKTLNSMLNILGNEQALIWIQYKHEARQIKDLLGDKCVLFTSDTNDKTRQKALKDFRAGKLQYIVAHPKTIGHGVTLININKAIYYSLSYSYEEFKQSQDRIYRYGQDRAVIYYILQAENNLIDSIIYKVLSKKETNLNKVLEQLIKKDFRVSKKTTEHGATLISTNDLMNILSKIKKEV